MAELTGMELDASVYFEKVKEMNAYFALSRNDALRQEMGLLARELMNLTQPFGLGVGARQQGEAAVSRDIQRVFTGMDPRSIRIMAKKLKDRTATGTGHPLFDTTGLHPQYHQEQRDSRGRVRRQRPTLKIKGFQEIADKIHVPTNDLKEYIKKIIKHVGAAKSGWLSATDKYGTSKVPQFVQRHREERHGSLFENLTGTDKPYIEVRNHHKAIAALDADSGLLRRAFQARTIKIEERLKNLMENLGKVWKTSKPS